eukprot:CAMPEP_0114580100 /NCGR_PEP_ID=MMETSP0125-20121206/4437_1 /TAXON_ID=485358 ORGANISM="Aristerostoma sp., Strain ATCC 50986" /NCGR_SAMPLE_ID=MMETSP0125 /ASSEMBLY_ACC=CAM_ASM_000245 /LENGTH=176 /DNA_ID=CAMNT_0001771427 /DNA_START=1482 /DNA_END=2012 /DNA_ORIENTATION=-
MLIAIMGDSYERVLMNSNLAESKEKISMIFETIVMKRAAKSMRCRKRKNAYAANDSDSGKKFLFHINQSASGDEQSSKRSHEWEGRLNAFKKHVTNEVNILKKEIINEKHVIQNRLIYQENEIERVQEKLQGELNKQRESMQNLNQKLDKIVDLVAMAQQHKSGLGTKMGLPGGAN